MIGDVEKGAKVSAKGNIVVLGALRGAAYAGICGNEDAVIVAFEMAPMSVRIAGLSLKKERFFSGIYPAGVLSLCHGKRITTPVF